MPDNLQWEMDKISNRTKTDILHQQSDQPEIFSESLQEGIDTSNIKQKQKRSREQQLLDEILNQQSNVGGIKPQFASLRTAGDTAAQDVGTYPYYKEQGIEVPDREAIDQYLAKNKLNQGIETIDRSEFIDDANYIPKWNEYTVDPEYNEEEGEDYPVGKQMSPFKRWSKQFWANPGQRVMQGINMAFNPFGNIGRAAAGYALQGGQNLRQGLTNLRGGYATQGGYNQARDQRMLAKRIRQRTSDKTQANIQALNADRQQKFQDETRRLQEAQWQQQAPQVQQNIQTYGNRNRPNTGMNAPGGGRGQSPTGGDVAGSPFYRGGRVNFSEGGLASLWI
jgi:hypothetical protein